jgi:hypothetical protein
MHANLGVAIAAICLRVAGFCRLLTNGLLLIACRRDNGAAVTSDT